MEAKDQVCTLCGKTREQIRDRKLILGVKGGVCLDCLDACKSIVSGTEQSSPGAEGAYRLVRDGECVLCIRASSGYVRLRSEFIQGVGGVVCLDCITLCNEVVESVRSGSETPASACGPSAEAITGEVVIRPLATFDTARFTRIASGYTSHQRYAVRKEESEGLTTFTLELEELDQPYTRRWDEDANLHRHYQQVIAEQRLSLGAYDGGLQIGIAIAEPHRWNRSLWVWEFHVHADYRGQGIGRRLMEALADQARRADLSVIVCETQNTNVPAICFYRRLGFELDGVDLSYYPPEIDEVAFFMKRKLNAARDRDGEG